MDENIKLDHKQRAIYSGLKNIGEEISAFYLDGLKILQIKNLEAKAYLLAHISREIEAGLRDILVLHEKKIMCKECNQVIRTEDDKHVTQICTALDVKEENPLAIKWHRVAKKFHKYAHRRGAWKEPREVSEFQELWNAFEEILYQLIGTYYNLLDLLDRLLKYQKPSTEIIETLTNLLKVEARYSYFFKNLKSLQWLVPLKEKNFFNPTNNPPPQEVPDQPGYFTIPHWSILDYLEHVANKNKEEPERDITDTLIEIVNSIINDRNDNGKRIDNYRTDWIILKIVSTLPVDKIEDQHIEFVRTSLKSRWGSALVGSEIGKSFLSHIIQQKATPLILKLLDIITDYRELTEKNGDKYKSLMEKHWLSKALKNNTHEIIKICGIEAALIVISKIKSIIQISDSMFHILWIPTIENHPQNRHADKYECQMVHFLRDTFEQLSPVNVRTMVKSLLLEDHIIFKRLAVHTINHHFDSLNDMFWTWDGNPLDIYGVKHELFELLKNNCVSFDKNQIKQVMNWIETKDYYIPDEIQGEPDKINKSLAYKKREWIFTLLEAKHPDVITAYETYEKTNPVKIDHPGFDHWSETRWGSISPITPEEICAKSNSDIADYLNNFQEKSIGWKSPTKEGLSSEFRTCISSNPEKFTKDLNPFFNVQRTYQHDLLWGLWEAWRNKKSFEWDELLAFILKIISAKEFWEEEFDKSHYDYRNAIISQVSELINDGTRNDSHAFKSELLPEAEKILLALVEKTESTLHDMGDLITSVLNSTKGNIFSAMVNYSLRYARLNKKNDEERWIETIKVDFNKRLDRTFEPSFEFSVTLGQYLPNLHHLSKNWVIDNVNRIFPKDNDRHWQAAFMGYLFYASSVYEVLYSLLRKNEHYNKAIETDFNDDRISERLVQHICTGYLQNWEKLEDKSSLLYRLIDKNNPDQLSEIVSFYLMIGDRPIDKTKLKPLWKSLFDIASLNIEKFEYQNIMSAISKWISLIDEIDDEIFEMLKYSAKYVEVDHNTSMFVEYLAQHVESDSEKVGKLYIEMLYAGIYPTYQDEDIKAIIESLYSNEQTELADRICTMYGEAGYDHMSFIRELYEKNKRK